MRANNKRNERRGKLEATGKKLQQANNEDREREEQLKKKPKFKNRRIKQEAKINKCKEEKEYRDNSKLDNTK